MAQPTTTPRHRDGYSLIRDIALTLYKTLTADGTTGSTK